MSVSLEFIEYVRELLIPLGELKMVSSLKEGRVWESEAIESAYKG